MKQQIVFATNNAHKLEEVAAILCAEHCRVDGRLEEILKK